ncbi:MAG: DUF488 domain-containing protein [Anaerolineae bacterium]|nr:DUF488 domain-containing protein [Anaerolineae bacterium]
MDVRLKRVYDVPDKGDGRRVLVDRVWPRGLKREMAYVDLWLPEIAPSASLRQWFSHDPSKWQEFKARYFEELDAKPDMVGRLLEMAGSGPLTLLFSARDRQHNQAVALREYLLLRSKEANQ